MTGARVRIPGAPCIIPTPRDGTITSDAGGATVIVTWDDGYCGRYKRSELTVIPLRYHGSRCCGSMLS